MNDITRKLIKSAKKAKEQAYAPYSEFHVGSSVLTINGKVFSGCNVENSSYGLTICAERNAVFQMVASGEKEISKIVIVGDTEGFLPPCGACRQVISEFASAKTEVILVNMDGETKSILFNEIMPFRFFLREKNDSE